MSRLINCLKKSKLPDDMKMALRSEALRHAGERKVSLERAEKAVVGSALSQAGQNVQKVSASLKAAAKETKGARPSPKTMPMQFSARTKPFVDTTESVRGAFERMHQVPEERLKLMAAVQARWEAVNAKIQGIAHPEAAAPRIDLEQETQNLENRESLALENLTAEEADAQEKVSQAILDRYADPIQKQQDIVKRRALEREAQAVSRAQVKGVQRQYAEKRKTLTQSFTQQRQALKVQAESEARAATAEGARQEAETKKIQTFAQAEALTAALSPEERGKVGGGLTLAQLRATDENMTDYLVKRVAKIGKVVEESLRKQYVEQITALSSKRPKRQPSGVVKSTIGADAQEVVDRVARVIKTPADQVEAEIVRLETAIATGDLSPEASAMAVQQQDEWKTFGDLENQSAAELSAAHSQLENVVNSGRAAWAKDEQARLDGYKAKAAEIVAKHGVKGTLDVDARDDMANWPRDYAMSHLNLATELGRILEGTSFPKDWADRARRQEAADIDFVHKTFDDFIKAAIAATGGLPKWKVAEQMAKMGEKSIATLGGNVSMNQAIYLRMAWAQADVRKRMEKQGWTQAHIDALAAATNDPLSVAMMAYYYKTYAAIYDMANTVHRAIYGTNLPKSILYAPMRYESASFIEDDNPLAGIISTSGLTPGSLKTRVPHNAPIRIVDSMNLFQQYVVQMSHWVHFAELSREMKGVLGNNDAKLSLKARIGTEQYASLMHEVDMLARGGAARKQEIKTVAKVMRYLSSGIASAAMALSLRTIGMQWDSAMRWTWSIPFSRWIPLIVSGEWLPAIKVALDSETVQRRIMEGMNPLMQHAMQANNLTPSSLLRATRFSMTPVKYIDAFLTSLSGAMVYADAIRQGATEEAALDMMDEAIHRYSQPITMTSRSRLENLGAPELKYMSMFMADPRLKSALFWASLEDIKHGKNVGMAIQRIVSVELMSLGSQMVANVFIHWLNGKGDNGDDEHWWIFDHWLKSLIIAPFSGAFFFGAFAESVVAIALHAAGFKSERDFTRSLPGGDLPKQIEHAIKHGPDVLAWEHPEKALKEIQSMLRVAATAMGPAGGVAGAAGNLIGQIGPLILEAYKAITTKENE